MTDATGADAYVGLGANLGEAAHTLSDAAGRLAALPNTRLTGCSSLWRSAPVAATGPDFFNAVIRLRTTLSPDALLAALQAIELDFGRERPFPNAPRTLDLDLLLHGDVRSHSQALTLPHPRMHQRAFVLAPLAEIDPSLAIGAHGRVDALRDQCRHQAVERIGPLPIPGPGAA